MDRRQFLERSVGAGLLLASAGCSRTTARDGAAGSVGGEQAAIPWGVQLYTVRSLMSEDVERTLGEVARLGYREVEFAGYFDRTPAQIRAALNAEGLTAPATHLPIGTFRGDLDATLEMAVAAGHRYLVLPSLPAEDSGDVDAYRRLAEEMNGFGERCAAGDVRFAFHNHSLELEPLDGTAPLGILIERTDPALVAFEVDLFWMIAGGGDPFDYFERYPGRFELCHVKDRTASGQMVDVGAGVIDFRAIFERSGQAGLTHYFVEHDTPADPLASIRASYDHLSSLDGSSERTARGP